MSRRLAWIALWTLTSLLAASCSGGGSAPGGNDSPTNLQSNNNASLNKDDYPVFPNADEGADPAVPAEQGGKGFTGEGWETNTSYELIGDPRAVKGGVFMVASSDFPTTLRYYGPNISIWNFWLHSITYETLVGLHPTTLEYMPRIATHWQISADKKTYRFRLDPNARWSDGGPVVADDVVASWKLVTDKGLQDPGNALIFSQFEQPVAESKYIVTVKSKAGSWRDFMNFATGMFIYPAHALEGVDGAAYIKDFNYKMLPGSGPYMIAEADISKGNGLKIRRRPDYWAANARRNAGVNNFDVIDEVTVRDRNLEFEKFKRGDLDLYAVNRASMWVNELEYDNIQRGLNQKRKVFNHNPNGIQGFAFNTRREPFNDVRVRKALAHLFNREQMIKELIFNEYTPMHSIFPDSPYENPNNEKITFDPQKAVQLLAEAGFKDRDSSGRLTRSGKPLNAELIYASEATERYATIFQEDLRKVGITLSLRRVTFETFLKLMDERTFDIASGAYTGSVFPDPEPNWLSRLADEKNNNNITGFKSQRGDELIAAYIKEFDLNKRIQILQEFDKLFTDEHHWILEWTAPYQRFVYWNKFGQPQGLISDSGGNAPFIGDQHDPRTMWWIDPEKAEKLEQAKRDPSINLGKGETDDRYWIEFATTRQANNNPAP